MRHQFMNHAASCAQAAHPEGQQWSQEFASQQENPWAEEFGRSQAEMTSAAEAAKSDPASSARALEQTRALVDTLSKDADPKFQNSKFLQFVSKMSRGEIILEDNQVCGTCNILVSLL